MKGKHKRKPPEIVIRDGKPAAVIIELDEYEEMLERLEEIEDLKALALLRKRPMKFKKLDEFLKEYSPGA